MRKVLVLSSALALLSCAVMEAPQGGPKDETPPRTVDISPAPGSVGVDRNTSIEITFSEKVDGESFKKRLRTYPQTEFKKSGVKGDRLEIQFKEQLPETTICVVINGGYSDYHSVKSTRDIVFYFSTRDTLDAGRISGRVLFKMSPDSTGLVKLIAVSSIDSTGRVTAAEESRIAFCEPGGRFAFEALPTDGSMFRIWAFTDRNNDVRYSPGDEFQTVLEDTFVLTAGRTTIDGVEINIIDPDEPGSVKGVIDDLTGLGINPSAKFQPLSEDADAVFVRADTLGAYSVSKISPGEYILTAFIDMLADSMPGTYTDPSDSTRVLQEPFTVYPDTVRIAPGESVALDPILVEKGSSDDR